MTLRQFYKSEWFLERPDYIQKLFKKYPVNKQYYLHVEDDKYYGIRIIGIDEMEDGLKFRIVNDGFLPPMTQRSVFDVDPKSIYTEKDVVGKEIVWETEKCLDIK